MVQRSFSHSGSYVYAGEKRRKETTFLTNSVKVKMKAFVLDQCFTEGATAVRWSQQKKCNVCMYVLIPVSGVS